MAAEALRQNLQVGHRHAERPGGGDAEPFEVGQVATGARLLEPRQRVAHFLVHTHQCNRDAPGGELASDATTADSCMESPSDSSEFRT